MEEFTRWLASLGVGGAIAGIIFYFYNKMAEDNAKRWEKHADMWKEQADMWKSYNKDLLMVIKDNTAAFTRNTDVIESFHRRLDQLMGEDSPRHSG